MLIRLLFDFLLHSESLYDGIAKAVVDALSRKVYRKVQCEVRRVQTFCMVWVCCYLFKYTYVGVVEDFVKCLRTW